MEGIPDAVRGRAWYLALGNYNAITRDLFEIMAQRGLKLQTLLKTKNKLEQTLADQDYQIPDNFDKLSGCEPKHVQTLLTKLIKTKKKLKLLMSQQKSKERSVLLIETDIPRTFAHVSELSDQKEALAKILQAFTVYRPDIGYVQGMSYVAAMLHLHMKNEYMTFVAFCTMMTKYPILPFYSFNDVLIRKVMQLYKHVFAYNLPELCEHFELEGIQP